MAGAETGGASGIGRAAVGSDAAAGTVAAAGSVAAAGRVAAGVVAGVEAEGRMARARRRKG